MKKIGGWNWIDRTGMRFGKLVAIKYLGNKQWLCQCDCGQQKIVCSDNLSMHPEKRRGIQSCGCGIGKLSKNNNYFSKIDDENKAYILGFLCADGTVSCKHNSYSWKIRLQRQDEDILIKIKEAVHTKPTIKYQHDVVKMPQGNLFQSETASLLVCNKQNVLDLIKYGIVSNKTHDLHFDFNCMDADLYKHFFRGLYDGDGTFGVYKSKTNTGGYFYETILTGYYDFLVDSKKILSEVFPCIQFNIYHAKGCAEDIYRMSTTRKDDFFKFLGWMYDDNNISIDRKFKKYVNLKEQYI